MVLNLKQQENKFKSPQKFFFCCCIAKTNSNIIQVYCVEEVLMKTKLIRCTYIGMAIIRECRP